MFSIKNVLIATDFSECSVMATEYGRTIARKFGARLHVLHTVEPLWADGRSAAGYVGLVPELQTALEDAERAELEEWVSPDDRRALDAAVCLRKLDTPAHAIVEYAQQERIDLIVLGTHGRHGLAHAVMGSVAERVIRTAPCPVLTVKGQQRHIPTTLPASHAAASA